MFNLFLEEPEGYAKLLEQLIDTARSINENNASIIVQRIQELIGCFDMSPNRVLDVLLDIIEHNLDNTSLFRLVEPYHVSHIGQLIGFKYRFYQQETITPTSLHRLAALLIQRRMINVDDLYGHLAPADTEMHRQFGEFTKAKMSEARGLGQVSLTSTDEEEQQDNALLCRKLIDEEPAFFVNNQKLDLIVELLNIDAHEDALRMLTAVKKLKPNGSLRVAKALCESIRRLIDPILVPHSIEIVLRNRDSPSLPEDQVKCAMESKVTLTEENERSVKDQVLPLLSHLGIELFRDVVVFTKVVRLITAMLRKAEKDISHLISTATILYAAHSLSNGNTGLNFEVWKMMQMIPLETRFSIYSHVKDVMTKSDYKLLAITTYASSECRKSLKRLVIENVKQQAKGFARLSHSNPHIVCERMLDIVESYENIIPLIAEACRYVSGLFYDEMTHAILLRVVKERPRIKSDGTSISSWLQNISIFTGLLFKKNIPNDLFPLIKYVTNRIKQGVWEDLVLLKEMFRHMAEIEFVEDLTDAQLEAHAGGEVLRSHAGGFKDTLARRQTRNAVQRLKEALIKDNRVRDLILLLARLRDGSIFLHDDELIPSSHLRLVTDCLDKCHETLLTVERFLQDHAVNFVIESTAVPESPDLMDTSEEQQTSRTNTSTPISPVSNGTSGPTIVLPPLDRLAKFGLRPETAFGILRLANTRRGHSKDVSRKLPDMMLHDVGDIAKFLPDSHRDHMVADFYVLFWMLELYDIHFPSGQYEQAITRIDEMTKKPDMHSRKRDQYSNVIKKLQNERTQQSTHIPKVSEFFNSRKDTLLVDVVRSGSKQHFTKAFIQLCILPRVLYSSADAVYCAKFVEMLHNLQLPGFSPITYVLNIVPSMTRTLVCLSEMETQRMSRFIEKTLQQHMVWWENESAFDTDYMDSFTYIKFRDILIKSFLDTNKIFLYILSRGDVHSISNALTVLNRIAPVFPRFHTHAIQLKQLVDQLRNNEIESIKILATNYSASLKKLIEKLPERDEKLERYMEEAKKIHQQRSAARATSSSTSIAAVTPTEKDINARPSSSSSSTPTETTSPAATSDTIVARPQFEMPRDRRASSSGRTSPIAAQQSSTRDTESTDRRRENDRRRSRHSEWPAESSTSPLKGDERKSSSRRRSSSRESSSSSSSRRSDRDRYSRSSSLKEEPSSSSPLSRSQRYEEHVSRKRSRSPIVTGTETLQRTEMQQDDINNKKRRYSREASSGLFPSPRHRRTSHGGETVSRRTKNTDHPKKWEKERREHWDERVEQSDVRLAQRAIHVEKKDERYERTSGSSSNQEDAQTPRARGRGRVTYRERQEERTSGRPEKSDHSRSRHQPQQSPMPRESIQERSSRSSTAGATTTTTTSTTKSTPSIASDIRETTTVSQSESSTTTTVTSTTGTARERSRRRKIDRSRLI